MYYLYLDESGDLGHYTDGPGASRYFVITVLEVRNEQARKAMEKAVERTVKNKLHKKRSRKAKPVTELKATATGFADKQYFYHSFSHEIKLLQAVDLFAWGFFRKYEVGDTRWYDVFREKVVFERVYPYK
ncbi:DUF3800 domain-containing protein [candidate division KSB1 bacterium]|nr:DUF3800 domain-containing protein [candidate division KSB1 bacterium]